MYTGALENWPGLVGEISRRRRLWGNDAATLKKVRSPLAVAEVLRERGLPYPALSSQPPGVGRWLVKPLAGAGGRGIRFADSPGQQAHRGGSYFQELIDGPSCAAVYLGDGRRSQMLGITTQLVGQKWLNAAPFSYCGSVGPLWLDEVQTRTLKELGAALVGGFGLRGLFGVDFVLRDGIPYPVEINPRYTASMEVVDQILGLPLLALHRRAFEPEMPEPKASVASSPNVLAKAIFFAPRSFLFPADGPWMATLRQARTVWTVPSFADIPQPGSRMEAGRPVLTFFAHARTMAGCVDSLKRIAAELQRALGCL
jgi:predicted ATP-grasp superfamily ATP-dependent carboligase